VNRFRAHEIALEAQKQLVGRGLSRCASRLLARTGERRPGDLRAHGRAGDPVRVREVEFTGDTGLDSKALRGALQSLRARRLILWRLAAAIARRRSTRIWPGCGLSISPKDFLNAKVRLDVWSGTGRRRAFESLRNRDSVQDTREYSGSLLVSDGAPVAKQSGRAHWIFR